MSLATLTVEEVEKHDRIIHAIGAISDAVHNITDPVQTASEGWAYLTASLDDYWQLAKRGKSADYHARLVAFGALCCHLAHQLAEQGVLPTAAESAVQHITSRDIPTILSHHDAYGRLAPLLDGYRRDVGTSEFGNRHRVYFWCKDILAHTLLAIADLDLQPWPAPPEINEGMTVRLDYAHPATARFLVKRWPGRTGLVVRASTAGQHNCGGLWVVDLNPTAEDPRRREIQCSGACLVPV